MSAVGHSAEQLTNYSQSYDAWPFVKLPPPVNQLSQWCRTPPREENFLDEADPSLVAQNMEDRMLLCDGPGFADPRQQVLQLFVSVWRVFSLCLRKILIPGEWGGIRTQKSFKILLLCGKR